MWRGMEERSKTNKFGLALKALLLALALAVMVGFGAAMHTAESGVPDSADNRVDGSLSSEMGFFDPFTLNTVEELTESSSEAGVLRDVKTQPTIRIPFRPALRSPIRPPLVQP